MDITVKVFSSVPTYVLPGQRDLWLSFSVAIKRLSYAGGHEWRGRRICRVRPAIRTKTERSVFSACDLPPRTMCQILMAVLQQTLLLIKLILIGLTILYKGKPLEVWLTWSAFEVSRTFANPASTRPASEGLNEKANHAKSYRRKGCEMSLLRALLCLSQTMNQSAIYLSKLRGNTNVCMIHHLSTIEMLRGKIIKIFFPSIFKASAHLSITSSPKVIRFFPFMGQINACHKIT